jgi:hypothetical protein
MAEFQQSYIKCTEGSLSGKMVYLTFNPETVTFSKGVKWTKTTKPTSNNPDMDFGGGKSGSFKISDITFDATMLDLLKDTKKKGSAVSGTITTDIEQLVRFTEIDDSITPEPRPPQCQFVWGSYKSYSVYVQSVTVNYELFDASGKPLRAKVSVDFVEADDATSLPYQNPTSRSSARKVRTVLEGETLDWIAYQEYGSAAAWRHIAETNNLDDPSDVRAGQVLRLVPLV